MNKYRAFYIPYFIFVLILTVLILANPKAELHLWLNSFHSSFGDTFFKYFTEVGGSIPFVIAGIFLFVKYRISLYILATQLTSGLVVQIAKRAFDEQRPKLYFQTHFPNIQLPQIEHITMYSHHSFPSGHTASAFALFLVLSHLTKKTTLHFIYFVLALLVGFSRIYLSQHFALDVLIGSLLGVFTTIIFQYNVDKAPIKWAEGSLRDVFSGKVN